VWLARTSTNAHTATHLLQPRTTDPLTLQNTGGGKRQVEPRSQWRRR
jgi:hypothetical protein